MKLNRIAFLPWGTYGTLRLNSGTELYTCEKPWVNNQRNISCIPDGLYYLRPRYSTKFNDHLILQNAVNDVYEYEEDAGEDGRYLILMHNANWPSQLQGCIAVGSSLGVIDGQLGVRNSKDSMTLLMNYMENSIDEELLITTQLGAW